MEQQYLIDTNIVSDFFSDALSDEGLRLLEKIVDNGPNISVITQIELLCWVADPVIEQKVKEFTMDSVIFDISPIIVQICVNIRKGKKIKTPDAIIAATAMAHDYILVTNNEKDFANIPGVKTLNPYKFDRNRQ